MGASGETSVRKPGGALGPSVRNGREAERSEALAESGEARISSVDYIVFEILRGVYEGRFAPGQKLLESELTQRFGVGRGSVREAIRRLEAEGMVSVSLHRGASIRAFTRDGVRDLLEVTEHLVGMAARLAAERIARAEDAAALRETVTALSSSLEQGDGYAGARIRYRFYQELVALTQNQELARLLPRFDVSVLRAQFRSLYDLKRANMDLAYFQRVADAILARDGLGAERVVRQYFRRAALATQQLPDHYFAD